MFSTLLLASALAAVASAAAAPPNDTALVAKLITENTQVNKVADITPNSGYVFDFTAGARGNALGGFAIGANSANFPALLTGNGAMTVGVLGPCGANSPHTHPRATEIQIVVSGGPIYTEFIMENGANVINNTVPLGSATIFPKGTIHFQQNMACEPTIFIASFDEVDPGTSQIAQNFFKLNQAVVEATLGDFGVSVLDATKLPENIILGAQECLDRCKIDRSTFNFTASFGDYAIFTNSSWGTSPSSDSKNLALMGSSNLASGASSSDTDVPFNQNPLHGAVIGLAAASAALLITAFALAAAMARRSKVHAHTPVSVKYPEEAYEHEPTDSAPLTYYNPHDAPAYDAPISREGTPARRK
ncbi:RmlC-like cupin [Athelia psychrophila]|uniref:RmlC-like cupin n=1 Tax=Athelia psychrophila TaxID=1759441 RepID=A0A166TMX0_9AGAM|nr:RmlC-like cupin [Fibularhizoctonia sp. CBS 109695]